MSTLDWMGEFAQANRLAAVAALPDAWPEEVFAALFQQHYARVVGVAARLLGERSQAEEVADDAFWKLYHQPKLQADGNNIAGWLYRTASRLAIDALRARHRGRIGQQRLEAEAASGAQPEDSPLGALVRREQVERVRQALRRLRPAQAQILALRHSGLSYLEIAATLRMKASSVGTTLARAETAFEHAYAEEGEA